MVKQASRTIALVSAHIRAYPVLQLGFRSRWFFHWWHFVVLSEGSDPDQQAVYSARAVPFIQFLATVTYQEVVLLLLFAAAKGGSTQRIYQNLLFPVSQHADVGRSDLIVSPGYLQRLIMPKIKPTTPNATLIAANQKATLTII